MNSFQRKPLNELKKNKNEIIFILGSFQRRFEFQFSQKKRRVSSLSPVLIRVDKKLNLTKFFEMGHKLSKNHNYDVLILVTHFHNFM